MNINRLCILGLICLMGYGCSQDGTESPEGSDENPKASSSSLEAVTTSPEEPTPICTAADPGGCMKLGEGHISRGEHVYAKQAFKTACEQSIPAGCGEFGKLLAQGFGGSADPKGALDNYIIGCSGGHLASCTFAGRLVSSQHLGEPDAVAALSFFRQSCPKSSENPHLLGCELLGLALMRGEAGVVDFIGAKGALELACTGEMPGGCHHLGTLYRDGLGVEKNADRALQLHEKGCAGGTAEACASAGVMLQRGLGVTQDLPRALPLLKQGCLGGNKIACAAEREVENSQ